MMKKILLGFVVFSLCCNVCFAEYESQNAYEQALSKKRNIQTKTIDTERIHNLFKEDFEVYTLGGRSVTGDIKTLRDENMDNPIAVKILNEMLDITEFEAFNDYGKSLYKQIRVKNEDYDDLSEEVKKMIFGWNFI